MSSPNRTARRKAEREMSRLLGRMHTQPDRSTLGAPKRHASSSLPIGGGLGRGAESLPSDAPPHATRLSSPAADPHSDTPAPDSTLPVWSRLLTLPPGLDPSFRAFLFEYVETHLKPADAHEQWLSARIALAMARLHLNALREPESISLDWLRYEAQADRQLRAAERDLKAYQATRSASLPRAPGDAEHAESPITTVTPTDKPGEDDPQSSPNPRNQSFARTNFELDTIPAASEATLAELQALTTLLASLRVAKRP